MPLVGGIVYGERYPYTLSAGVWIAVLFLLVGLYLLGRRHRLLCRLYGAAVLLSLFALGGALTGSQLRRAAFAFPEPDRPVVYRFVLASKPESKANTVLFRALLKGKAAEDTLGQADSGKTFLCYFPKDSAAYALRRGDELLVYTRLSPPTNQGNPDEFDYARYLRRKGVSGTAYVRAGCWCTVGHDSVRTLRQRASDCRERLVGVYRNVGFRGDELAVLSALTVGDKEELSEDVVETYSVAGASHILALSGLHIGLISALLLFFFAPLWNRWRVLKPFLFLLVIALLGGFAFLTGLSASVVRAVVLCSLGLLSVLFSACRKPAPNLLAATAFLMLLFNPMWLFDVGFQLSFSAVVAILLLQPGLYGWLPVRNGLLRKVWGVVTVSVAAQIGTAPLLMLYFLRFSTHFLLTNLWIIPLASFLVPAAMILFALTPFPGLQHPFATLVDTLLRMQNALLRLTGQLPLASVDHIRIDAWEVVLCYLFLFLCYRALTRRTAANVCIALSGLLLCASYHAYLLIADAPRCGIVFCNVRGCPAVHCLTDSSRSWLVCADSLSDAGRVERSLSAHWGRRCLDAPTVVAGDYSSPDIAVRNRILFYAGMRICLLHDDRWRNKRSDAPVPVDYLYISRGYRGGIKELTSLFEVGTVVLDSSLSAYYRDKLRDECTRLGLACLSLSEKGALHIVP